MFNIVLFIAFDFMCMKVVFMPKTQLVLRALFVGQTSWQGCRLRTIFLYLVIGFKTGRFCDMFYGISAITWSFLCVHLWAFLSHWWRLCNWREAFFVLFSFIGYMKATVPRIINSVEDLNDKILKEIQFWFKARYIRDTTTSVAKVANYGITSKTILK